MFKNVSFFENFVGEERCRDILAVQIMQNLKVHKIEIFFGFDLEICIISLIVMSKYQDCAADFSLLNLPKEKSLGRSKLATNS
jgi:hypothetical protein